MYFVASAWGIRVTCACSYCRVVLIMRVSVCAVLTLLLVSCGPPHPVMNCGLREEFQRQNLSSFLFSLPDMQKWKIEPLIALDEISIILVHLLQFMKEIGARIKLRLCAVVFALLIFNFWIQNCELENVIYNWIQWVGIWFKFSIADSHWTSEDTVLYLSWQLEDCHFPVISGSTSLISSPAKRLQ